MCVVVGRGVSPVAIPLPAYAAMSGPDHLPQPIYGPSGHFSAFLDAKKRKMDACALVIILRICLIVLLQSAL